MPTALCVVEVGRRASCPPSRVPEEESRNRPAGRRTTWSWAHKSVRGNAFGEISRGTAWPLLSPDRRPGSGAGLAGVHRAPTADGPRAPPDFRSAFHPGQCSFLSLGITGPLPSGKLRLDAPSDTRRAACSQERDVAGSRTVCHFCMMGRHQAQRPPSLCLRTAVPGATDNEEASFQTNRASGEFLTFCSISRTMLGISEETLALGFSPPELFVGK